VRRVVCREFGPPERLVLEEAPDPKPGPDEVPGLPAGSRVAGCWMGLGGYATHRLLPAEAVVPLPAAVSFEVAATAVDSYATMLFALTRRTSVWPGEWVVVLGAGGGIGLAAVDVASSLGARVIAAASSRAKLLPVIQNEHAAS
jgi:NADPH:quinone reductase